METPAKRKKDPAKSETQKPKQEKSGASNDLTYKSNQMPAPEYGENRKTYIYWTKISVNSPRR